MAMLGLKKKCVEFCINVIFAGTKQQYFGIKRKLLNSIGHEIGKGTKIVGPIQCSGCLIIGKNCWIGKNFVVNGNGVVKIGENCDIAPEVTFQTGGHEIGSNIRRAGSGFNRDIEIGNGCWIGVRGTILGGVKIGSGCVVASCACVNKSVPDNCLVGGIPAKIIRELEND